MVYKIYDLLGHEDAKFRDKITENGDEIEKDDNTCVFPISIFFH